MKTLKTHYISLLSILLFLALSSHSVFASSAAHDAAVPVDHNHDDEEDSEYNLVCHQGSDEYCHNYFGHDYCCAKWSTSA